MNEEFKSYYGTRIVSPQQFVRFEYEPFSWGECHTKYDRKKYLKHILFVWLRRLLAFVLSILTSALGLFLCLLFAHYANGNPLLAVMFGILCALIILISFMGWFE